MGSVTQGRRDKWKVLLAGTILAVCQGPVSAAPCPAGLIVRQAAPGDTVCVTRESRRRAAADNARAALLWVPGPFGPKTCAMGFVWRQAFAGDVTCVTPDVRAATLQENGNPRGDPEP
jgi:hypothetical protein